MSWDCPAEENNSTSQFSQLYFDTSCQLYSCTSILMSVYSRMLANVSLEGYDVNCSLAKPSAAAECLPRWFVWYSSESTEAIIQILNKIYQIYLNSLGWFRWICEQFGGFQIGSVNPSHYQIICAEHQSWPRSQNRFPLQLSGWGGWGINQPRILVVWARL